MNDSTKYRFIKLLGYGHYAYLVNAFGYLSAYVLGMILKMNHFDPMIIFGLVYWFACATNFGIFLHINIYIANKKTIFAYTICMLIQMVLGSIYPYICTGILSHIYVGVIVTMIYAYLDVIFMLIAYVRYTNFGGSPLYFDIWFFGLIGSDSNQNHITNV